MKKINSKKQDKTEEILEIVQFIKDNAVTHEEFNGLAGEVGGLTDRLGKVESDIMVIKAEMVTKDYLDDKLADLRGDLVVLTRKEDGKVKELVKILQSKKVLNKSEVKRIFSMPPFPELAL
ncbi:hypothetical protein COZ26_00550 [Candidatus Kuenenbacteria bacterium CG_4_10_14_3_um_filter_39_14]|uniref:Uncharacterized protein n=1 Tax=Candidatus Kuenenbacteria bacterium CG_4_10_14_3_um_filter_39_14 TaxID=1974614 RepID=A0A2M7MI35_9BACT|nr:MAG: hypothetical protein COZ26_00550 [Candidatus Kuenenbacteria bacterium CG_4_10_14_3_um_filter_39_14]